LISAILSTVDSCLLAAASLVSHNLVVPLNPRFGERGKILCARVGVVVWAAGEYWLEWSTPYLAAVGAALTAYLSAAALAPRRLAATR